MLTTAEGQVVLDLFLPGDQRSVLPGGQRCVTYTEDVWALMRRPAAGTSIAVDGPEVSGSATGQHRQPAAHGLVANHSQLCCVT